MPLHRLEWQPGFNSQQTQTKNRAGWFACNLVRWRLGLLEKLAGWQRLFNQACGGIVRCLHAYLDLSNNKTLMLGEDTGPQLYILPSGGGSGTLYNVTFYRRAAGFSPRQTTGTPQGIGSSVVTITDNGNLTSVGETVLITPMPVSVAGYILPAGTALTVASIVDANHWTFNLASPALNTNAMSVPQVNFMNSGNVQITFKNHGQILNSTFTLNVTTVLGISPTFYTAPAGNYTVTSVIDANNFAINLNVSTGGVEVSGLEGTNTSTGFSVVAFEIQYVGNPPTVPQNWFADNQGQNGLICFTGSPIYVYTPPATTNPVIVQNTSPTSTITSPQANNGMLVAMPQAQIIAFGTEASLGSGIIDPLLIRFSDAGSYSVWTASADNQAGSFRLGGSGSEIVGAIQAPQTTLIFTDVELWGMTYVGSPFVYSFTILGTGCGLIAPHAQAILGRTTMWVSLKGLFSFSDSGVVPVECPLWDQMFANLNQVYLKKIFCGSNMTAHEIWIFYPSLNSTECDSYIKVNMVENLWDYGTLDRSAWCAENDFGTPLGGDWNTLLVQQHEQGYDADGSAMSNVYAETGYADIGDGDAIMFIDEFIPDMKWFGNPGSVAITMFGTMYPGANPTSKGPYGMDQNNRHIRPRMRARQIALRFDWAAKLGFSARLGTPRVRSAPSGRRP